MEGARWDDDNHVIEESFPKVLFDPFPVVYMKPVEKSQDATGKNVHLGKIQHDSTLKAIPSKTLCVRDRGLYDQNNRRYTKECIQQF